MNHHTRESLIAFETRIKEMFEAGELPFLLHLCGGNEGQLIDIFGDVQPGDWILSGHRSHYHYLLTGGSGARLEELIRDGRSMFVFDQSLNFLSSAILGGMCGIAAGLALALRQDGSSARVWCFLGDGAEDQGHTYEAIRYVTGHNLPCVFVIEDNDRQVDTSHAERWGTEERFAWPRAHVRRYHYTPTYPHAGRGAGPTISFQPAIVAQFVESTDEANR